MRIRVVLSTAALLFSSRAFGASEKDQQDVAKRLDEATSVLSEVMSAPDKGIPEDLLNKAHCVAVVPGLKQGAFIVGGKYGKGFFSCRTGATWSAPGSIRIEGGSVGFQIGGSETDLVLLVMNERGAQKLLSSKFTLGAQGEVAAGPVGRSAQAQTDAKLQAEMLAWSRTRGVFAGVSLQGATLRQDLDDNDALYGKPLENQDLVNKKIAPTAASARLMTLLKRYSPHEK